MPTKEEGKFQEFVNREKEFILKLADLDKPDGHLSVEAVKALVGKVDTPEKLNKFTNTIWIMSILFEDGRSHVAVQ